MEKSLLVFFLYQVYQARHEAAVRRGETCQAIPTSFWSSLINLISNDTNIIFHIYHSSSEDFKA